MMLKRRKGQIDIGDHKLIVTLNLLISKIMRPLVPILYSL